MPLSKYFRGEGRKTMGSMKEQYGEEKGEEVFYRLANKRGQKPGGRKKRKGSFTFPSKKRCGD